MKKIFLVAAVAACALTVSAQETKGRPGVVVTKAETTKALADDMVKRGMKPTMDRITEAVDSHLEAAIAGSRKFTVLARGITQDVSRRGTGIELTANDYTITIKFDSYLDNEEKLQNFVKRRLQLSGQVTIVNAETWEVLDMSNIQIEETDTVQVTAGVNANRLDAMLPALTRKFAADSFERLMGVAFPMKVLDAEDGVITINRGEEFLSDGDKVEVFGASRTITDPDTGEKIKIKGKSLGTATITSTEPNYSQAKADGAFTVPTGAEIRKLQK